MKFDTIEALRNILEYLKEAEGKHWEESWKPEGHIYLDILAVERWLDGSY